MRPISPAVVCAVLLIACSQEDHHGHPQLKTGQQLYVHHCAPCHQVAGGGTFLQGVPPVKDTSMSYRQMTDHIRGADRADGSRMPEFSTMPRAEAGRIARYIRAGLQAR
jgi:mono/diheme cytochrome c family protein